MYIYKVIKHIYPEIDDDDFVIYDDGTGPSIIRWNSDLPQPTEEELVSAWEELGRITPEVPPDPESELEVVRKENEQLKSRLEAVEWATIMLMDFM